MRLSSREKGNIMSNRQAVQNIATSTTSDWNKHFTAKVRKLEAEKGRKLTGEEWGQLLDARDVHVHG